MEDLTSELIARIAQVPVLWVYGLLLVAAFLENICPPVPGDVCIIFGGYLASNGMLGLPLVIALGTLGGILGFMTVFYVGRTAGERLVTSGRIRWINPEALAKVARWVARWGPMVVLANRFFTAVRSVVALSVGMGSMRSRQALWLCAAAALVWTALLASGGYAAGENWERIWDFLTGYSRIVLVVILLGTGVVVWRNVRKRKICPERTR